MYQQGVYTSETLAVL